MDNITNKAASKHLGRKSKTSDFYNPSLLVAVPRAENRKQYSISDNPLPFDGFDVWHAYEFSFLTNNGLPVTRVLKLKYPCNSKFIVESKSLKLYLNSFNMSKFGNNSDEGLRVCLNLIKNDLSKLLKTDVQADFIKETSKPAQIFSEFTEITNIINENEIKLKDYKESPQLLKTENSKKPEIHTLKFGSLRSNCRVTHQPDFGDAYIYYKSSKHITEESLIAYLTSFRSEYHFHEECCEMIFKRLSDILNSDDELLVCTLYTRRGGIDINPVRYKNCNLKDINILADMNTITRNGIKQ